jgi:hypothetical protein
LVACLAYLGRILAYLDPILAHDAPSWPHFFAALGAYLGPILGAILAPFQFILAPVGPQFLSHPKASTIPSENLDPSGRKHGSFGQHFGGMVASQVLFFSFRYNFCVQYVRLIYRRLITFKRRPNMKTKIVSKTEKQDLGGHHATKMLPEGPVFSSGRVKVFGWNSRGFWV